MKFGAPFSDEYPEVVASYETFVEAFHLLYPGTPIDFAVRGVCQPHAPSRVGHPGVVFLGSWLSSEDHIRIFPLISKMKNGRYRYLGTYKYVDIRLEPKDWLNQSEGVSII